MKMAKCFVLYRRFPAVFGFTVLLINDVPHHVTPRSGCRFGIAYGKVSPGNLQIDYRLPVRFISRLQELLRFFPVLYAKRCLFSREVVLNPINRTTKEHPILLLYAHNSHYELRWVSSRPVRTV